MTEYWKDVIGYEGLYSVSNLGNIFNHKFQKMMKSRLGKNNGYMKIGLTKDGKQKTYLLHRLVAIAHIPNLDNKPEVNHKDNDRLNNNINNLEWVTAKQNSDHRRKTGIFHLGENMVNSKIKDIQVMEFLKQLKINPKLNISKYSRDNKISRSSLNNIKHGKLWKHLKEKVKC